MALNFEICKVGKSADCTKLFIEDKTEYVSIPPDDRASYALFLVGFFYNKEGDDERLTIDNTLPLTVTTWEVEVTSDGYHYFDLLPILVWTSTNSYSIGDIVYENTFYWKALTNNSNEIPTNTEGAHWEKVDDPYTEVDKVNDLGNPVIDKVTRYDDINLCKAEICYGKVVAEAAKNNCKDCSAAVNKDFMRVDVLLQSAFLLTAQTKFTEAHDVALVLQDICNDLTDCGCS